MINLYAALGLDKAAHSNDIAAACEAARQHDPEIAEEASRVLLDPDKRALYDQVYVQFEALALVNSRLMNSDPDSFRDSVGENVGGDFGRTEGATFVDTNHWTRRLVEFS